MEELLTADAILAKDDRRYKIVEVPEWGGKVRVRSLSGQERDKFEASSVKVRGNKREENFENFRARLVALSVVDNSGLRLFPDAQIPHLGQKNAAALQRVFNVATELNGMSDADVEELTESFDEAPDESSTSD